MYLSHPQPSASDLVQMQSQRAGKAEGGSWFSKQAQALLPLGTLQMTGRRQEVTRRPPFSLTPPPHISVRAPEVLGSNPAAQVPTLP